MTVNETPEEYLKANSYYTHRDLRESFGNVVLLDKALEAVRLAREEERGKNEAQVDQAVISVYLEIMRDLHDIKKDVLVPKQADTIWVGYAETLFDRLEFLKNKYGKGMALRQYDLIQLQKEKEAGK